ncbi:MAG: DsbA family oxidoreductase [Thermomicrobiales bacterium]|nr:DsbA family oxidoreductase [Thermomicrobiales bacterium]
MIVDVYHDIVCPWCRIGKAHLDQALSAWDGPPVEVRWRPFLLNPEAGPEPTDLMTYFREHHGVADPSQIFARVEQAGANAGLRFRFDRALSVPTRDAHRLLALTAPERQPALLDALHHAYFEEGANLADLETLADLAGDVGEDRAGMLRRLRAGEGTDALEDALRQSAGIVQGGVPFFVFDDRYALSGAQPPEMMLRALAAARDAAAGATAGGGA